MRHLFPLGFFFERTAIDDETVVGLSLSMPFD
jgi:hypothetical protein